MLKRLESPCLNFNSPFIFGFTLGAISTFLAERKGYTGYEWEKEFAKKNTPFLKKKTFSNCMFDFLTTRPWQVDDVETQGEGQEDGNSM